MFLKEFRRGVVTGFCGALLLAAMTPLAAQEKDQEKPPAAAAAPQPHVVKMLHADPRDVDQFGGLLGAFGVGVNTSEQMGLIAISGPPENIARAEEAFKMLQTERAAMHAAPRVDNVEMTIYLLGIGDGDAATIPAGPIREVVTELKKTFPFSGYKLLETFVLRARVGQDSSVTGALPSVNNQESTATRYDFSCKIQRIQGDPKTPLISIDELQLRMRVPVPIPGNPNIFNYSDIAFRTALEVPDGKTVVVGKAGAAGDSQGYLVVLTAKVVR